MEYTNQQFNNINKMYPYGDFPYKYTKKQKDGDLNNPHIFNYYTQDKIKQEDTPTHANKETASGLDINSIIPIISTLSSGKKMESSDLISTILPLMIGSKSKELTSLLKLFNKKQQNHETLLSEDPPLPQSKYNPIESYERI